MRGLLLALLASGCVLDRTGQSATSAYERELAVQRSRAEELSRLNDDLERRLSQLEEVARYRGQQEAAKLENIDQVRAEVQRLRGEVETTLHQAGTEARETEAWREDAAFRLVYLEQRVAELEKALGLKPPPPDAQQPAGPRPGADPVGQGSGEVQLSEGDPVEVEVPAGPDELLALAEEKLRDGQPRVARALLDRFIRENPDHTRILEARYRYAETWFNDGQYNKAVLAFQDVVDAGGTSPWVAWSLVRQGECFRALGMEDNAVIFWEDVIARFPSSKAAKEAKTLLDR